MIPKRDLLGNPCVVDLDVGAFDGRPGDAVGRLLLARVTDMRCKSVVKRFTIDVLCVLRQTSPDRRWQVIISSIRHVGPCERTPVPVMLTTADNRH